MKVKQYNKVELYPRKQPPPPPILCVTNESADPGGALPYEN